MLKEFLEYAAQRHHTTRSAKPERSRTATSNGGFSRALNRPATSRTPKSASLSIGSISALFTPTSLAATSLVSSATARLIIPQKLRAIGIGCDRLCLRN